jgi:hypothetical protein
MAKGRSYRPEMVNSKLESISAGWATVVDFCKHSDGCFDSVTSTKLIYYLNSKLLKEDLASGKSAEMVKCGMLKTHSAVLRSQSLIIV